jgi:hypothetical protein
VNFKNQQRRRRLQNRRTINVAAGSRHLFLLAEQYEKGVVVEDRANRRKVVLVRQNPYTAELLRKGQKALVAMGERLVVSKSIRRAPLRKMPLGYRHRFRAQA